MAVTTTITMPQLGETVTEGTVAQWLKRVGDAIEKYEPFVEISTDKVNAEVPSPVSGVLASIIVAAGETVPTGAPIAVIEDIAHDNGATPVPVPSSYGAPASAGVPAAGGGAPPAEAARNGRRASSNGSTGAQPARRLSPAVRRLAREHRVDAAALPGTGTGGRVTAQDVIAAATREAPALQRSSYAAPLPGTLVPLTPARKLIAQRMTESLRTAPHAWTMVEVDMTKIVAWRAREKERFLRTNGYPLTLLPFFIFCVLGALRAHPLVNARFTQDGIVLERSVHIGIAIGLEANLVVPVIRDADSLSIAGLAIAAGKLVESARSGKLGPDELGGGTFTVNNTGANGSILSIPIINAGQAAIITMEAVVKRPVVVDDAIAIRSMMNVCLSLDHRVLDGTSASGFLKDVKRRLETIDSQDPL